MKRINKLPGGISVPWDEKTSPEHPLERVKLDVPWNEGKSIPTPPLPKRKKGGRGNGSAASGGN